MIKINLLQEKKKARARRARADERCSTPPIGSSARRRWRCSSSCTCRSRPRSTTSRPRTTSGQKNIKRAAGGDQGVRHRPGAAHRRQGAGRRDQAAEQRARGARRGCCSSCRTCSPRTTSRRCRRRWPSASRTTPTGSSARAGIRSASGSTRSTRRTGRSRSRAARSRTTDVTQLALRLQASVFFTDVQPMTVTAAVDNASKLAYYKFTLTGKVLY